ncbi:hypothetical protein [Pseudarthrobacter sp. NIBRBAC000502771]|uniref:DUF7426 family protein n=1 Tax=Pseudarthrobacter sp. NIBRBAC000502771 TaxID=2590774 RepID=UPI00112FFBE1|nr:hypothetical protein [Pseudarthrobacter sp. NIBRBAC000502771]QDG61244.1 hypothetical protein NIBR502771_02255 [Pseudarthrobacter sp. NIBRBAC000502771]
MALRPYEEIVGPLVIPARGKHYTLPIISLQDGLRMHAAAHGGEDLSLADLTTIILGDARQQMLDDGVPLAVIDRALWAGIADYQQGREAAEQVWENGVPKAVLEELTKILTQAPTTPPAAESTTPPPGSGTTTKPKRARASRGKASSPTGS